MSSACTCRTPRQTTIFETLFEADGAGTLMTMRMTLPDGKTRAAMLATGMERGMEASYVRLEGMLWCGLLKKECQSPTYGDST
jgi:hypothetical protein